MTLDNDTGIGTCHWHCLLTLALATDADNGHCHWPLTLDSDIGSPLALVCQETAIVLLECCFPRSLARSQRTIKRERKNIAPNNYFLFYFLIWIMMLDERCWFFLFSCCPFNACYYSDEFDVFWFFYYHFVQILNLNTKLTPIIRNSVGENYKPLMLTVSVNFEKDKFKKKCINCFRFNYAIILLL